MADRAKSSLQGSQCVSIRLLPAPGPLALALLLGLAAAGCGSLRPGEPMTAPEPVRPEGPAAVAAEEVAGAGADTGADSGDGAGSETPPAVEDPDAEPAEPEEIFAGEDVTDSPLDALAEVVPEDLPEPVEEELAEVPEPVTYDIPMVTNDQVLFWIDYHTNRNRENFLRGMERSGRYLDMFREIFRAEGLPEDLVYMAHVESNFKTTAYSRARARGIWQFMSYTGRHYGLKIDYWVDERSDPEKSARAAAAYLKKLHGDFGDWYLAMAAYNAGEGKVTRGLRRSGADDFWSLAKTRHIRRETKNYLPAILAAIQIYKDPARFGMEFAPEPPIAYETIAVEGAVDLRVVAKCAGREFEELRTLNPMLRRHQTPPNAVTEVRVPPGTGAATLAALESVPRQERVLYARHQVRRGDTLSTIARAYGTSVSAIQATNNMGRRTMIRVGQELQIPSAAAAALGAPAVELEGTPGEPLVYRVRRGDTLSGIGRRYGTTAAAIAEASGISTRKILRVGERLTVVPGARAGATAVASRSHGSASGSGSADLALYRVRRGDTLSGIARRFDTTARAIAAANGISTRKVLQIGEELRVAPGVSSTSEARRLSIGGNAATDGAVHYTVRSGDNLWSIARSFATTVDALCAMNRISEHQVLMPGTKLRVQ